MKRALLVAMGMFLATAGALAQGNVLFQSKVTNPAVNFKITNPDGSAAEVGKYTVELWGALGNSGLAPLMGSAAGAADALIQTPLSLASGYFAGGSWSVTGIPAGVDAQLQVRVWETQFGSYNNQTSGLYGMGTVITVKLTEPPATPQALVGMANIALTAVPEPSILALGMLGLGALMLRRRS